MEKKKYISVILVAFLLVGLLGCAQSTANRNDGGIDTTADGTRTSDSIGMGAGEANTAIDNDHELEQEHSVAAETFEVDENDETEAKWARLPMVMVDGVLYYDAGRLSTVSARCGNMDGEITSAVDCSEIPTENNQSNFGTGYGYQIGPMEGTIEVCIDGNWNVFATKEVREQIQFPDGADVEPEENSHLPAGE